MENVIEPTVEGNSDQPKFHPKHRGRDEWRRPMSRAPAHYFRDGVCVNSKPAAKQARKRRRLFARAMALDQFDQRHGQRFGNALSISTLRWQR
jgi:hypothetical protein